MQEPQCLYAPFKGARARGNAIMGCRRRTVEAYLNGEGMQVLDPVGDSFIDKRTIGQEPQRKSLLSRVEGDIEEVLPG